MAGKSAKEDQSKNISVRGGCVTILGQLPPDDPVCDSGIYCYGKQHNISLFFVRVFFALMVHMLCQKFIVLHFGRVQEYEICSLSFSAWRFNV